MITHSSRRFGSVSFGLHGRPPEWVVETSLCRSAGRYPPPHRIWHVQTLLGWNREVSCPAGDGTPSGPAAVRRGAVAVDEWASSRSVQVHLHRRKLFIGRWHQQPRAQHEKAYWERQNAQQDFGRGGGSGGAPRGERAGRGSRRWCRRPWWRPLPSPAFVAAGSAVAECVWAASTAADSVWAALAALVPLLGVPSSAGLSTGRCSLADRSIGGYSLAGRSTEWASTAAVTTGRAGAGDLRRGAGGGSGSAATAATAATAGYGYPLGYPYW